VEVQRIEDYITGRFSILAMYPSDTQVLLKIPDRLFPEDGPRGEVPFQQLCSSLAQSLSVPGAGSLTFSSVPLSGIFTESPHARWATLRATLPPPWLAGILGSFTNNCRSDSSLRVVPTHGEAFLSLYPGGILTLMVELFFDESANCHDSSRNFPDIVRLALDSTVRYEHNIFLRSSKETLDSLRKQLRTAAERGILGNFLARYRNLTIEEIYPTILTKIECRDDCRPAALNVSQTDIVSAMFLDESELPNALPSFERDYLAVGYDASLLLYRSPIVSKGTDLFEARIHETFSYSLALWMQIYLLNKEVHRLHNVILGRLGGQSLDKSIADTRRLREEIGEIWQELAPGALSTWVTDVYLFQRIRRAWFLGESTEVLKTTLDKLHDELVEIQQIQFTRVASIFAASGLAGLLIAAITLFATQTSWEQNVLSVRITFLVAKVLFVAIFVSIPVLILRRFLSRWSQDIERWSFQEHIHREQGKICRPWWRRR